MKNYHSGISIGDRIKEVRLAKGLTQKEFADSLGIVQGFLSGIERGKKVPSDTLRIALCHFYEINPEWLLSGKGEKFRKAIPAAGVSSDAAGSSTPLLKRISEGFPAAIAQEDICDVVSLPGSAPGSYALIASGDYMAPTIRDGDLVIFQADGNIDNGDIVLVTNRWGEAILRRYRLKDGELFFSPDNSAYAPFKPDPDTRTIGLVIDVWRKVNF